MNTFRQFTQHFTDSIIEAEEFFQGEFVRIPSELRGVIKRVAQKPVFVGVFLGRYVRKTFHPSPALLQELALVSDKKIVVDDRAAWLFLCGRDLFGSSVTSAPPTKPDDCVLVMNRRGDCLGYGICVETVDKPHKVFVKNVYDIGNFLRRERFSFKKEKL